MDGLRAALIASSHFGLAVDLAALGVFAVGFLAFGSRSFARIQV